MKDLKTFLSLNFLSQILPQLLQASPFNLEHWCVYIYCILYICVCMWCSCRKAPDNFIMHHPTACGVELNDFHCLYFLRDYVCVLRMCVRVCMRTRVRVWEWQGLLALCAFIAFHSGTCFNGSYFPDGTLGNDNLWAIQSNYSSCVWTKKKSHIINNE